MSEYAAPLRDMQFVLHEIAGIDAVGQLPGCEEVTPDVVDAILEEAGKFAAGVLSPLNRSGDQQGAQWRDGAVSTAGGWGEAYAHFVAGGWQMARAALAAQRLLDEGSSDAAFLGGKIISARFYADHVLSQAPGLAYAVCRGAAGALEISDDQF